MTWRAIFSRSLVKQLLYKEAPVRIVMQKDDPWFVAKDICDVLEMSDTSVTISKLDEDERGTSLICTPGGTQQMSIVSEPGLYKLIGRSRKPEAKSKNNL